MENQVSVVVDNAGAGNRHLLLTPSIYSGE
jgi:hypothetical protein